MAFPRHQFSSFQFTLMREITALRSEMLLSYLFSYSLFQANFVDVRFNHEASYCEFGILIE